MWAARYPEQRWRNFSGARWVWLVGGDGMTGATDMNEAGEW